MLTRADWHVVSDLGIEIAIREVLPAEPRGVPVLMVHGGGGGGPASFDLGAPGGSGDAPASASLAGAFADAGHPVYLLDIRGWGASTRPPALAAPPDANPPAVRSDEAMRDIIAAVAGIRARPGRDAGALALLGWATGGHWAAMFAAHHPGQVSHLISLNSLYSVDAPWGLRAAFEAPESPGAFDPAAGAYGWRSAADLVGGWERSIPVADRDTWRDPRVAAAYAAAILASDPLAPGRMPLAVRSPRGFQLDSYQMSRGHRFWDAAAIRARTLIVRGERDFWSRPIDVTALAGDLTNAAGVATLTIPDATHFVFLDHPERGRAAFVDAALAWLR